MSIQPSTAPVNYLSRTHVLATLGRSPEWLRCAVRDGRFPPPRRFGGRTVWPAAQVEEFLATLPVAAPEGQSHAG
jgi:predicted DNA-binding transcriptional regulator AlpA